MNMKHFFLSLLCVLSFGATVRAVEAPEFKQLQANYKAAIERVTTPLTQTYLVELEKRRDSYARGTNLEAANLVQAEINSIKQAIDAAELEKKLPARTQPMAEPSEPTETGKALDPKWFVGKTWQTDKNTEWSFTKDGTGTSQRGKLKLGVFTWRVLDSSLVELSEKAATDKPVSIQYVQFKSRSEAWKGSASDKLTLRLFLK